MFNKVGYESVRGVNLYVTRDDFGNGELHFHVYRDYDDELITEFEHFTEYPTQDQLDALMSEKGLA